MLRILCEIPNLVIAVGLRALVGRRVRLCGLAAAVAVQPEERAEGACEHHRRFSTLPMFVPSLSWQNDRFEYNIAQMSAFFRTELEPADDHLLERGAVRVATGVATNVCGPKGDPCTKRNATLFLNISHVCPEPVLV
jgi:hypothetical protein